MLARIRNAKENGEGGFTLIELLVVVIIIGILAAIAIPTFLSQREKAWEKALKADLHNNAVKMEEYKDDNGSYPSTVPTGNHAFKQSANSRPTTVVASGPNGFCLRVESTEDFTGDIAYFDSKNGKPVIAATAPTTCTAASYA